MNIRITVRITDAGDLEAATCPLFAILRAVADADSSAPACRPSASAPDDAIVIDGQTREVRHRSHRIPLTRREFDLLLFLAEHPRQVFTRPQLLSQVWPSTESSIRTVDVHVRRLRMKLSAQGPLISTVHGFGYRLDDAARIAIVQTGPPAPQVAP